ncbi:MAG: nitronate monooxygenase [Burkholderiales bacterium]|nr:nitronate monooxygenase [Burkholderiales bacterium]
MRLHPILTDRLGMRLPIIQAPMAGGTDTPAMVAAVSEAGGLGCIGAAYLSPTQILEAAKAVRARTARPFSINLFSPDADAAEMGDPAATLARIAPYFAERGLPPPAPPQLAPYTFEDQFAAALETGAAMISIVFGRFSPEATAAARAKGMLVVGAANSVAEGRALKESGVDAIVAQGSEAGGHRAVFLGPAHDSLVGTMALVPQLVDATQLPILAAGGIMDGRGIAAALALGACGVQMGTAFLNCDESGISAPYRQAVDAARDTDTRLTRAFSGRYARGLRNRFIDDMVAADTAGEILPFPWQNALTRPLRTASAQVGDAGMLSMWAGQGVAMARRESATHLMARLEQETTAALNALGQWLA